MNKRKILKISIVIISVISVLFLIYLFYHRCGYTESFSIPNKCKVIMSYSSGTTGEEKSRIIFYDEKGEMLSKSNYKYNSCINCIEYDSKKDLYNFFTHQEIFNSNGLSIENKDMQDKYSFALIEGDEDVYKSGYFDEWEVFYKVIPHGLSYDIAELGKFDLICLYNDERVDNIRIAAGGNVSIDRKEKSIYVFADEDKAGKTHITYEIIKKMGKKYIKSKGELDITQCGFIDYATCVDNAIWDGDDLYLTIEPGEGENCNLYILHYRRKNNIIRYVDSTKFEYSKFGFKKPMELSPRDLCVDSENTINYYISYFADTPGILKYDKLQKKFFFEKYKAYSKQKGEYVCSTVRLINGKVYMLIEDESGVDKIFMECPGGFEKVMKIDHMNINNMNIVDFYVIE